MNIPSEDFPLEWETAPAIDADGEDVVVEYPSFMKKDSYQWRFWLRKHGVEECELCFVLCEPVKGEIDKTVAPGVEYTTCYYCAEEGSGAS